MSRLETPVLLVPRTPLVQRVEMQVLSDSQILPDTGGNAFADIWNSDAQSEGASQDLTQDMDDVDQIDQPVTPLESQVKEEGEPDETPIVAPLIGPPAEQSTLRTQGTAPHSAEFIGRPTDRIRPVLRPDIAETVLIKQAMAEAPDTIAASNVRSKSTQVPPPPTLNPLIGAMTTAPTTPPQKRGTPAISSVMSADTNPDLPPPLSVQPTSPPLMSPRIAPASQPIMAPLAQFPPDDKGAKPLDPRPFDIGAPIAAAGPIAQPSHGPSTHALQSTAAHVAQQIATAALQSRAGVTEISLNPIELGRVRMALTTHDQGIAVSILAERPETADLMRRNLDQLAREFRDMGYDTVTFSFGDPSGDSPKDQDDAQRTTNTAPLPEDDSSGDHPITYVALSGGLDLKL